MASSTHHRNRGERRGVPRHRRMAIDIANAAMRVPSFPVHRTMQLGEIEQLRLRLDCRIGWASLLASTYSRVSQEFPELRDIYVESPVPYLYRHPQSVASITVHRSDDQGLERLVWGRLIDPHLRQLDQIQEAISSFATSPIESFFRDGLKMERQPRMLRRFVWWVLMRWSGRRRAKHLGTFSISNLGGRGALNAHFPLVTTTALSMGPIQQDGRCDVVMLCDHRVLDGVLAANVLASVEHELSTASVREMQQQVRPRQVA